MFPVTVMVPVMGEFEVFAAIKLGRVPPLPLDARPMLVLLFAQVKLVPAMELVVVKPVTTAPLHTITLAGVDRTGTALTIISFCRVVVPHSLVTANEIV